MKYTNLDLRYFIANFKFLFIAIQDNLTDYVENISWKSQTILNEKTLPMYG